MFLLVHLVGFYESSDVLGLTDALNDAYTVPVGKINILNSFASHWW